MSAKKTTPKVEAVLPGVILSPRSLNTTRGRLIVSQAWRQCRLTPFSRELFPSYVVASPHLTVHPFDEARYTASIDNPSSPGLNGPKDKASPLWWTRSELL
jgi:hypothetical protein